MEGPEEKSPFRNKWCYLRTNRQTKMPFLVTAEKGTVILNYLHQVVSLSSPTAQFSRVRFV